jgi:hypothetical protein
MLMLGSSGPELNRSATQPTGLGSRPDWPRHSAKRLRRIGFLDRARRARRVHSLTERPCRCSSVRDKTSRSGAGGG